MVSIVTYTDVCLTGRTLTSSPMRDIDVREYRYLLATLGSMFIFSLVAWFDLWINFTIRLNVLFTLQSSVLLRQ